MQNKSNSNQATGAFMEFLRDLASFAAVMMFVTSVAVLGSLLV